MINLVHRVFWHAFSPCRRERRVAKAIGVGRKKTVLTAYPVGRGLYLSTSQVSKLKSFCVQE